MSNDVKAIPNADIIEKGCFTFNQNSDFVILPNSILTSSISEVSFEFSSGWIWQFFTLDCFTLGPKFKTIHFLISLQYNYHNLNNVIL